MCYLVTYAFNQNFEKLEYQTLPDARKGAEDAVLKGGLNVRVWLLTHSVTIQPQAVWKEHAKGLSGSNKEQFK